MYKNTGKVCFITVSDPNRKDGFRTVDLGNLFTDDKNQEFLLTSVENAEKYWQQVNVPILIHARRQQ